MAVETVVVTPASGFDDDGDPVAPGAPVTLAPLEVAPGNTAQIFTEDGALDTAEFTVYFPLRLRVGGAWVAAETVVRDDYTIAVRDRVCRARVSIWRSQRSGRGGVVVLCKSATGKS